MRVWFRRVRLAAIAVALVGLFLTVATSQGHAAVRTALFLPQIVPTVPVKPQTWVTGTPSRTNVRFPTATGEGKADLYTPAGKDTGSAILLFLGVNPAGSDDPRVVGLAEALARTGAVVMIPWSDRMTRKQVETEDVDDLVRAYQYLLAHDRVNPERAGMGGFCVGASFVTVAAADRRIRDDVKFINFFGGYFDAQDLVASVTSKSRFSGNDVEAWSPDKLSRDVVAAHLIDGLSNPDEAALLRSVFITNEVVLDDSAIASLSIEAQSVNRLLSGVDLREARSLISRLPDRMREDLDAISPKSAVADLAARVLIMHDREDRLVPSEESRRLAEALSEHGDVYHTEFSLFDHLDPTRTVSPLVYVKEMFKLYMHMYNVLRALR